MALAEEILAETKAIDDARQLVVTAADLDTTFIKANYDAGRLHLMTIREKSRVEVFSSRTAPGSRLSL